MITDSPSYDGRTELLRKCKIDAELLKLLGFTQQSYVVQQTINQYQIINGMSERTP